MNIEVWSDFVCPFCYIGKRRLEMAVSEFPHKDQVIVEYKSFELDPTAPRQTEKNIHQLLAAKFGTSEEQVRKMNEGMIQQAADIGLTYNYDEMKPSNTFDAHRLAKFAESLGKEKELSEKLFYSYFTDSKSLSDVATLADLAKQVGIDHSKAQEVLKDQTAFAENVRDDERTAQEIGVTGVPFFVINQKYAISGAQPLETFKSALEKVWEEEHPKPQFLNLSVDEGAVCTDDNCAIPPLAEKK